MDPEFFDIETKKQMAIWPRPESVSKIISPYIRRMKGDIVGLEVGILNGENSYEFLENCPNIVKMYGIQNFTDKQLDVSKDYNDILLRNMKQYDDKFRMLDNAICPAVDFLCINSDNISIDLLDKYYKIINSKGIICGTNHHMINEVRVPLREFRKNNKIGVPLNVHNEIWFWYKD